MKTNPCHFLLLALGASSLLGGCLGIKTTEELPLLQPADFVRHVKPVFEHRCARCHNDAKPSGGLNLQDRSAVLASDWKFLVPGKPEESLIYQAITKPMTHPTVMPGDGWGMSAEHKRLFESWIRNGADWPKGEAGKIEEKETRVELDSYL